MPSEMLHSRGSYPCSLQFFFPANQQESITLFEKAARGDFFKPKVKQLQGSKFSQTRLRGLRKTDVQLFKNQAGAGL